MMTMTPSDLLPRGAVIGAAAEDLRKRERNKERGEPPYERFAFGSKNVRNAKEHTEIMRKALAAWDTLSKEDRAKKSTKQRVLYESVRAVLANG